MDTKHIKIYDYDYELPEERIAKFPVTPRDHSKLLIYKSGNICEDHFFNLPNYLDHDLLMVYNNTRVIQARLLFHKLTGAQIEIFLMEPASPSEYERIFQTTGHCAWLCMVGNLKKWKDGTLKREFEVNGVSVELHATLQRGAEKGTSMGTNYWVDFKWSGGVSFAEILQSAGELPIPPYLNRATTETDNITYQTVYSKIKGSVAAPTAGLHFTDKVLNEIDALGIRKEEVTLHVGAGTFKPVKSSELQGHKMHAEYIAVRREMLSSLIEFNCNVFAVGTTSVRTLESLYYIGVALLMNPKASETEIAVNQWSPYELPHNDNGLVVLDGVPIMPKMSIQAIIEWLDKENKDVLHTNTQIIIAPGYKYKIVKMLMTNFHQPQSTLLLLVSAFVNGDWRKIYDYALEHDFRFLSYGDSSLLIP